MTDEIPIGVVRELGIEVRPQLDVVRLKEGPKR